MPTLRHLMIIMLVAGVTGCSTVRRIVDRFDLEAEDLQAAVAYFEKLSDRIKPDAGVTPDSGGSADLVAEYVDVPENRLVYPGRIIAWTSRGDTTVQSENGYFPGRLGHRNSMDVETHLEARWGDIAAHYVELTSDQGILSSRGKVVAYYTEVLSTFRPDSARYLDTGENPGKVPDRTWNVMVMDNGYEFRFRINNLADHFGEPVTGTGWVYDPTGKMRAEWPANRGYSKTGAYIGLR